MAIWEWKFPECCEITSFFWNRKWCFKSFCFSVLPRTASWQSYLSEQNDGWDPEEPDFWFPMELLHVNTGFAHNFSLHVLWHTAFLPFRNYMSCLAASPSKLPLFYCWPSVVSSPASILEGFPNSCQTTPQISSHLAGSVWIAQCLRMLDPHLHRRKRLC